MTEAQLFALMISMATALGGFVWWLIRHTQDRLDHESEKNFTTFTAERLARVEDRHALRNEIHALSMKLQVLELRVAAQYVDHDRLNMAMVPIREGITRIEAIISHLRDAVDRKQDRGGAH